jgi:hypothetical protein
MCKGESTRDKQDAIESHRDVSSEDLNDIHETTLSLLEFRLSSSPGIRLSDIKEKLQAGHATLGNSTKKLRHCLSSMSTVVDNVEEGAAPSETGNAGSDAPLGFIDMIDKHVFITSFNDIVSDFNDGLRGANVCRAFVISTNLATDVSAILGIERRRLIAEFTSRSDDAR